MISFQDIEIAHARIAPFVHRTPVRTSRTLNEKFNASLFFKCENFQVTGSFKYRGATNAILHLTPHQANAGVLTYSSGNHAQALARAGMVHKVPVTVVMPHDAPKVKQVATREYGAEVILYDRDETTREALGTKLSQERGLTLVPPYDHEHIVCGAGTAVKELLEETGELDDLYVCTGGGGLLSGSLISATYLSPRCNVIGVEPNAGDDICRSVKSGRIETVHNPSTIADGARTPSASNLTFGIISKLVSQMISVSDDDLLTCMHFYAERMKMIVEPTGCLSLAGLWNRGEEITGRKIGIVISGGNVDLKDLANYWGNVETSH